MYRPGILILFLFLWGFFASASCPCDSVAGIESAFESSNVIFLGKPASIIPNWMSGGMKITFNVEKSWKRGIEKFFTLNVPEPANCGIQFLENENYLVFVNKVFAYQTDSCSRTKLAVSAASDIAFLGKSIPAGRNSSLTKWIYILGGLVFAGVLFMAFVVFRKKIFPVKG